MTRPALIAACATALVFSFHVTPVYGQHGSPKPSQPKGQATTSHASAPKASPAQAAPQKAAPPRATVVKASSPKTSTPKTNAPKASTAKATTVKQTPSKTATLKENTPKATALKSGTTAPSTSAPVPTQPLTPVQEKLARNTNLASKLQQRLPAGTNLQEAALGFRNLGQFVAAVNVSHNLSIPFDQLKANMVTKHMSLGQSIQQLKPVASPTVEAQRAEYDAMTLISQNPEPSQTGSTTTAAPKKSTQRQ